MFRSACPSGLDSEVGPGAGRPCDPAYGCSHGTHVAGIVAGANGEMSGVASQASIVAVQVFTLADAPDCGKCVTALMSDVLHGLEWVYRNRDRYNIAAVNLSPGGGRFRGYCDGDAPYTRIINLLAQANIATVVASGNDGFAHAMAQPACVEDAIAVGATSMRDHVAPFSNSTGYLDFLAPGHTESNDPKNRGILSAVPGTGFQRQSGTSMAAPHLAGAYAILKGAVPEATLWQMTDVLRRTGRLIQDPRNGVRTPRIQLNAAIAALRLAVARAQPKPQPRPSRYRHRKIGRKNDPKSMTASASKTAGMTARARAARTRLSGRDEQFELKKPPGTAISLAMDRASYEDTM